MLECVSALHAVGYVHGDVKPSNFLVGNRGRLVLIDFGLAGPAAAGPREEGGFTGTTRYDSLSAHAGEGLSWRDDMVSWLYAVVELARGELPWHAERDRAVVGEMKRELGLRGLCAGLRGHFGDVAAVIDGLNGDERPDYAAIRGILEEGLREEGETPWDWETLPACELARISPIDLARVQCRPDDGVACAGAGEATQQGADERGRARDRSAGCRCAVS